MKKVMLLGDSIRQGYRSRVAGLLDGQAAVLGPEENCKFSSFTLFQLSTWVPDSDYDAIQWNNGQWDVCYMPDGLIHTPLPAYLELQRRIASILLKKTRRLIFATTTPVWPEKFTSGGRNPRRNEDIQAYNQAASDLLRGMGVVINDLHALIATDIKRFVSEDMVHLTDAGNDLLAPQVARVVMAP